MNRYMFILFCAVLAIAGLPQYAQKITKTDNAGTSQSAGQAELLAASSNKTEEPKALAHYASGVRAATIPMDRSGHFLADFRINGRNERGLIDTGASAVAINISTARRLGVRPSSSDFVYRISTANGETKAAKVILRRMDVGPITVKNVEAFVLDDTALEKTLIGMSFMSKLKSYQVKNNSLELVL